MMIDTHWRMDPLLKNEFRALEKKLSAEYQQISQPSFFRESAQKASDSFRTLSETDVYFSCVNALKAVNDISWLMASNSIQHHMPDGKSIDERLQPLLKSINSYYSADDSSKEKFAREIVLQINVIHGALRNANPDLLFNACCSAVWETLMIGISSTVACQAVTLIIGSVTMATLGTVGSCLLGVGLLAFATATLFHAIDCLSTYVNLASKSQLNDLDRFSNSLQKAAFPCANDRDGYDSKSIDFHSEEDLSEESLEGFGIGV